MEKLSIKISGNSLKLIKISLFSAIFLSNVYSSDLVSQLENKDDISGLLNKITFYGLGEKIDETQYSGIGIKYNSDYSEFLVEKNDEYNKTSIVHRIDVYNNLYTKFGIGQLNKQITLSENTVNLEQTTLGAAVGYGTDNLYNIELGYFENKLANLDLLDTTKSWYSEFALKYDIMYIGSIDGTLSYQETKTYNQKVENYSAATSYYPTKDTLVGVKYLSTQQQVGAYNLAANFNYTFMGLSDLLNGNLTQSLTFNQNSSENIVLVTEFKKDIENRSLKIKNKFKKETTTSDIIAKKVDPDTLLEEIL